MDVGPYARRDLNPYRHLAEFLRTRHPGAAVLSAPQLTQSLPDFLRLCNAQYLIDGLDSLRSPGRTIAPAVASGPISRPPRSARGERL